MRPREKIMKNKGSCLRCGYDHSYAFDLQNVQPSQLARPEPFPP